MVLFFTAGLVLSILGMVGLLGFKRYELVSGTVLFVSVRPAVGHFFKQALWWVEKVLPALVRMYTIRFVRFCRIVLQRGIARSILWLEHILELVLDTVREQTAVTRMPGEASAFLREVAEHKRKLSRRVHKEHASKVSVEEVDEIAVQKSEFEVE